MFGELRKEIGNAWAELRTGEQLRTLTIAKPYCSPARDLITATFQQYGVKLYDYKEQVRYASKFQLSWAGAIPRGTELPDRLPIAQVATVTISEKAAAWAEYLLLRTGKLYCPDGYINERNKAWAARHGGKMPPAWAEGKPWIERGCSEGMKAWGPLRKARRKGRQGRR